MSISTAPDTAVRPVLADSVRLAKDGVHVLDRRVFPFEHRWVHADTVEEVARTIEDMVTQSCGPYFAALWGMVLAARHAAETEDPATPESPRGAEGPGGAAAVRRHLATAGQRLIATRPTNDLPSQAVSAVLAAVDEALTPPGHTAREAAEVAETGARSAERAYRERIGRLGTAAAELLPETGTILTHCWADLYLVETVAAAQRAGKRLAFVCTETRPYLQGSRLTAETLAEMGVDTTVITDGMGATLLGQGQIDALLTAADRVTMDGHVINKVGTLPLALSAHTFHVPYHVLVHAPDHRARTGTEVPIEYRDGSEVLSTLGRRTASDRVRGHYPAFDVTPPRFVTTVVTDRGAFAPHRLADYYVRPQPEETPS